MKKTLLILMALMLWICPVWADEIDDALPENTSLKIRNNTRQMVQAGMSQDDATQLTRSMLQHRFQEENTIQAQKTLMETLQSGLPVDPVMNKALEGMAKNKPDEAIVQAMKKTQSRFAYAYRKAQEITTDEDSQDILGHSIAQGMGAGLQDEDIDRVMAQLHTRTRQMSQNRAEDLCLQTFQAARVMARLGVDPDNVSHVVSQALQNRFTARQMRQLGEEFSNQSQQGSPNQLANQFAQQLGEGQNFGNSGSPNEDNGNNGEGNNGQSGSDQGNDGNGEGNDGQSGSDQGNDGNGEGNDGQSGSDQGNDGNDSDSAGGSNAEGSSGEGSGSSNSGADTGGSSGSNDGGGSGGSGGSGGNR
jgi:hypothetical protein